MGVPGRREGRQNRGGRERRGKARGGEGNEKGRRENMSSNFVRGTGNPKPTSAVGTQSAMNDLGKPASNPI